MLPDKNGPKIPQNLKINIDATLEGNLAPGFPVRKTFEALHVTPTQAAIVAEH
jgi:hypothetical protein